MLIFAFNFFTWTGPGLVLSLLLLLLLILVLMLLYYSVHLLQIRRRRPQCRPHHRHRHHHHPDLIQIRDGGHGFSSLLGLYCGTDFPPIITSRERRLWLRFHSDENIEYQGFVIIYEFIPRPTSCTYAPSKHVAKWLGYCLAFVASVLLLYCPKTISIKKYPIPSRVAEQSRHLTTPILIYII